MAWSAACCGGGFAAPALITGDDKAQVTVSYGYSKVIDDVGSDSLWRPRYADEISRTYKLEYARMLSDQWQAGLSVPVINRARAEQSSTGFGDIAGTLGYEFLPDWDYSPWRPKGLGFLQLTVPSGRSINEADNVYQLDARGRGFWALGLGSLLTKVIGPWDVFSQVDLHRSFNKSYSNSVSTGTLKPGYGGGLTLGGGYNLTALRFGGAVAWTYEDPVASQGSVNSRGSVQRFATVSIAVSYLFIDEWAATLTYTDQTLFGAPTNTTLSRGAMIQVQKRWPR